MLAPHSPPLTYWHTGGTIMSRTGDRATTLTPRKAVDLADLYVGLMCSCEAVGDRGGYTYTRRLADELIEALQSAMRWASAARAPRAA